MATAMPNCIPSPSPLIFDLTILGSLPGPRVCYILRRKTLQTWLIIFSQVINGWQIFTLSFLVCGHDSRALGLETEAKSFTPAFQSRIARVQLALFSSR